MSVALVSLSACSGKSPSDPIAECTQYEHELATCFHRPSTFASQPSIVPQSKEDRERIRRVCQENLDRLRTACR